jgi:hypothetical protein
MAELERAQERLTRVLFALAQDYEPEGEIAPAASAIEDAFAAVYDAFDERTDRLDGVRRASSGVDLAIRALVAGGDLPAIRGAVTLLETAKGHLAAADADLAARPERLLAPTAIELLASGDLPRLHAVERPSLRPRVVVPSPLPPPPPVNLPPPRPTTIEELREAAAALEKRAEARFLAALPKPRLEPQPPPRPEPIPGFAAELPLVIGETRFVEERTRELLEEVAMVGLQRAPLLGDPWRLALGLEQRMFRAIDAITSMGPRALGAVESLMRDGPVKDGTRVFAAAMTLGCIAGRDALAAAERVFFETELVDEEARQYLGAALKLAPHDLLPLTLRTLLADSDPRHRAMAIEVLGYRGLASEDELIRAAADDPIVAAAALPHLAMLRSPALRDLVAEALTKDDGDLRHAAWLAQCVSGDQSVGHSLRDSLDADPRAMQLLALWGDDRDGQLLIDRMSAPTPELVFAVGWTGHAGAIGPLIALLEGDDERLALAAAYALERITGAGLVVEAEIEAEEIEVPEPPEPDVGEPKSVKLTRLTSDPRDLPPEPSTETVVQPTTSPAQWRAWWKEHGERFRIGHRHRRGRPYTPAVSLWELDQGPSTPGERRHLQRELVIRSGSFVRFDPHDFVVTQEAALTQWAPVAERSSSQPGTWNRPLPR